MHANVTKRIPVTGLSCASCALNVEQLLKQQQGVASASVNYANSCATLEFVPGKTDLKAIKASVQAGGYDLLLEDNGEELQDKHRREHYKSLKINTILAATLSAPLVYISMFRMDMPYANLVMFLLSTTVIAWFGRGFFVSAWKQTRQGKANMDSLVSLSTGIAWIFSVFSIIFPQFWQSRGMEPHAYFEAPAVIIAFILLGKLLEERAKSGTSSAIRKLMGLQPATVIVIKADGTQQEIPLAGVLPGDHLLVKPGSRVPVDGELISGASFVDESTITGEAMPTEKKAGYRVFAGTMNQKGSFVLRAEKVGGDTILAQIIQMVQQAQGSKPPVQKLVDRIAGIFVPVVLMISVLSFILWMVVGGEGAFTHAILAMVSVLVIACPCALGLATPTAIMAGIGTGAENGILIKDAECLETAHRTDILILDKTGTITLGKPAVAGFHWLAPPESQTELRKILYLLESGSEHPMAEAITGFTGPAGDEELSVSQFESITGKGVKASVNGVVYLAGNLAMMREHEVEVSEELLAMAETWQHNARTLVFYARSREILALIAVADQIKETSAEAISELQKSGIQVIMLTGDNQHTASAIARQTGLREFRAGMLPGEKAEFVAQLQKSGKIVAMAGDGINDSQALAQADVSIAMGKGSDIAMDVAGITIISSDLKLIAKAFRLSEITVKTIRQNLFWAFFYNLIGIPVAAGILYPVWGFMLNPMIAGAAMAFSSVSVVSNSLRLKMRKI